jgi:tetratricopeptide (TPR) repeat protein
MEYCYALRINKPFIGIEYQVCAELPSELQDIQRIRFTANTAQGWRDLLAGLGDKEIIAPEQVELRNKVSYSHEALAAEAAEDWRKAIGFWQALLQEEDHHIEAHQSLIRCLRMQGIKAGENGEWESAMSYWEALLTLQPKDNQAIRQLDLVQHNQEYIEHYRDVEQLIQDGMPPLAKAMLNQLYDFAPYYGDVLKLGPKVGIQRTIRTPKMFEEEEGEKLEQKRRKEKEREARERAARVEWEAEQARITQLEAEKRRAKAAQEAAEQARIAEEAQKAAIRRQEEKDRADAARARQLAIERTKRRTPGWFISHELKTVPFVVYSCCFLLLSGLGSVISIFTQSWSGTIILTTILIIIAYALGYHRVAHRRLVWSKQPKGRAASPAHPDKNNEQDTTLVYTLAASSVVVLSCITVYCVMFFGVLPLHYNAQHVDHYLWISRTSWVGGQIKLGAIMGTVISLVVTTVFLRQGKKSFGTAIAKALFFSSIITFVSWVIISSCGLVLNLGWGFASGWEISLIGIAAGIAGGVGAGSSLVIWTQAWSTS